MKSCILQSDRPLSVPRLARKEGGGGSKYHHPRGHSKRGRVRHFTLPAHKHRDTQDAVTTRFRGLFGSSLLLSRYIHRNRSQRQTGITALPVKYDEKREYVRKRGLFVAYTGQWGKRKSLDGGEKVSVLSALFALYNIMLNPTTTPPTKTLAAETAPTRLAELLGV